MNTLLETYDLITAAIQADPLLSLAHTVAWLDPVAFADEDDDLLFDSDDGTLTTALRITRDCFPALYVQAVERLRQGASYADLDSLICAAITEMGLPLDSLEWIGWGIPMPAYGLALHDPDTYTAHPDIVSVLNCFGIAPDPNPCAIDVPECAYTAGQMIAAELEGHADASYRQIAWLMQWLFSCSQNAAVDYDYETMAEFQPLAWDKDDMAFAIEIIQEADAILSGALEGLAFLNSQPGLMDALQHNVQRIYTAMARHNGKRDKLNVRLKWPELRFGEFL